MAGVHAAIPYCHRHWGIPRRAALGRGRAGLTGPECALLLDRVDACLRDLAPSETRDRDRKIFWLYYRQGMTAKEIAGLPQIGLTLKGV